MTPGNPISMRDRMHEDYRWTRRQREVLDLLARGHTNTEIAEALGLSLAGAKWHVSEILSKLGSDSREEAAEYWRRYNGLAPRFARVFRGVLLWPTLRWTAIAAGAVAAATAGVVLLVLSLDRDADSPPASGEATSSPLPTATARIPLVDGTPGERWGGFIFIDPASPVPYTVTPPASGPVPGEEGIPDGHPGFRQYSSLDEAIRDIGHDRGAFTIRVVPSNYEFVGAWAIVLDSGRVVDFQLSYRRKGSDSALLAADLTIGWTDRAPRPLPARTEENRLTNGAIGEPVRKTVVNGVPAVFQDWHNPDSLRGPARVKSSLNWFEEGRLWAVQAEETPHFLLAIAESIQPAR